jgi:tRNA threonylcarbamoyladenosine biosynthesis protein TsaE
MELLLEKVSLSEDETQDFAKVCTGYIKSGSVVELIGELGAGKTYFVKSFCKYHGIDDSGSPSFSIVNEYKGSIQVYHFDFYRIKKIEELLDIGFYDYLNDEQAITFIEWGDMFEEILPPKRFVIKFEVSDNDKRRIKLYDC